MVVYSFYKNKREPRLRSPLAVGMMRGMMFAQEGWLPAASGSRQESALLGPFVQAGPEHGVGGFDPQIGPSRPIAVGIIGRADIG